MANTVNCGTCGDNVVFIDGMPYHTMNSDCPTLKLPAPPTRTEEPQTTFDLIAHLTRQREFSERTFGPGKRTDGVTDHIEKELGEVRKNPDDLSEWIDIVLLAFDGAWRHGHSPLAIAQALAAKQAKNEQRKWPDWRTAPAGKAIEHDRSAERP